MRMTAATLERAQLPLSFSKTPLGLDCSPIWLAHRSDLMCLGLSTVLASFAAVQQQFSKMTTLWQALPCISDGILILEDRFGESPLKIIRHIAVAAPGLRILILSEQCDGLYIDEILHVGARGFLCTAEPLAANDLRAAVQSVLAGHHYLSPLATSEYATFTTGYRDRPNNRLGPKDREVLRLLLEGCDVAATMQQLNLDRDWVYRSHRRLRYRFGVNSNEALIRQALLFGFKE